MSVIFDVILLAILVLTVIRHTRLGLACSVLSAGKFIFSMIVALLLSYPVAALVLSFGVPEALSGIVAFVIVFALTFILSGFLIRLLSKIKIPIITKVDKILGFLLGLILGAVIVSIASTAIYTVIELISLVNANSDVMSIYENSYVFKFIYELNLFEFLRNLF